MVHEDRRIMLASAPATLVEASPWQAYVFTLHLNLVISIRAESGETMGVCQAIEKLYSKRRCASSEDRLKKKVVGAREPNYRGTPEEQARAH
jgi:hypothetical protein